MHVENENNFVSNFELKSFRRRVVPETFSTQSKIELYKNMLFRHQNPILRHKIAVFYHFYSKTKVFFRIYSPQAHEKCEAENNTIRD